MIPYGKQFVSDEDIENVCRVLKSPMLTQGPEVEGFEADLREYLDVKHALACSNGTSALHLALLALDINKESLVWCPAVSFVATSNAALYCQANIDFVDIDARTGNIDVNKLEEMLEEAERLNALPQVLIVVHMGGNSCDMLRVSSLSRRYGFKTIEDASHCMGSSHRDRRIGSCEYSDLCTFSFHAVKTITTGEGGLVTTNNSQFYQEMKLLRSHGITKDPEEFELLRDEPWGYEQKLLGYNYRLTDIAAALGRSQLRRLDAIVEKRREIRDIYKRELVFDIGWVVEDSDNSVSGVHLIVLRLRFADSSLLCELYRKLRQVGIGVQLHYMPIPLQPFYRRLGYRDGDYPEAEKYSKSSLSLPVYEKMSNQEIEYVCDNVKRVLREVYGER